MHSVSAMSVIRLGLFLFAIFSGAIPFASANANQDPLIVERATEEEARQVQELSDTFQRQMKETRDVASLKHLFRDDFVRLQIQAEKDKPPGQSHLLIPSTPISIETDLTTQVRQRDWERFYAAHLNFRYYFVLLIASRAKHSDLKNGKNELMRKLFPAEVLKLLQADPFLRGEYGIGAGHKKYKIETLEEFESLTTTLEQTTLTLRRGFLKDLPEQTTDNRLIWPHVSGTEEGRLGFPKGTRFFHRITADSLFELWLVKSDNGMKIVWAQVYPFN